MDESFFCLRSREQLCKIGQVFTFPRIFMIALLFSLALLLTPLEVFALDPGEKQIPFSLPNKPGEQISLSDFSGKVILLDFWASWCPPCKESLPWMEEMQQELGSKGLQVVTINLDTERSDALKLIETHSISFPVLFDPAGEVAELYDLPGMPTSFVITPNGNVHSRHVGFLTTDKKEMEKALRSLTAKDQAS